MITQYRPGDADDFDRLYRDSYPRILRTLIGVLGDRAAAEDCTQDAFVRAYQAWGTWRGDAPAEAWLHRIALRVAISHRRHAKLGSVTELIRRVGRPHDVAPVTVASRLAHARQRLSVSMVAFACVYGLSLIL